MSNPEDRASYFEGGSANLFGERQDTIRGHIRYSLIHRNLEPFIGEPPLTVADVGGGSGIDSLWMAELGHVVVMAEPAEDQIREAKLRWEQAPKEVQDRWIIFQGTAAHLLERSDNPYDMTLSHCIGMYLQSPGKHYERLSELTVKGGVISIVEKGYNAREAEVVARDEEEEKRIFYQTGWIEKNEANKPANAFKPEQIENMIKKAGCEILQWTGVRYKSKDMLGKLDTIGPDEMDRLLARETQIGKDPGMRENCDLLHFIARKC